MPNAIRPLVLLGCAALALSGTAGAASVRNIQNFGQDGPATYYQVQCSDQSVGSVTVRTDPPQVCVNAPRKESACRARWELSQAAAHACR